MLKMYICALFKHGRSLVKRHYWSFVWLAAMVSISMFGLVHIHAYVGVNESETIKGAPEENPGLSDNVRANAAMFNEGEKKDRVNQTNKQDETKKDDHDNDFAKNMLIGLLQRQVSRRYEFDNLTETVYTTLKDVTHTCAEGEPPIKEYSKWFRNFCWFENDCGCHEKPSMLRCFPRFHLIGFPKAGTTDLYQRLMMHPHVLDTKKETNYWSVTRFLELGNETEKLRGHDTTASFTEYHIKNLENASVIHKGIQPYLDFYLKPLRRIEEEFGYSPKNRKVSTKMFGEGSVTYAYSSLGLRISIGHKQNKSPMEVDCNIAKIIRWMTPKAKVIVSLRDPVERLYSDYRNLYNGLHADNKTAADFHKRVVNRIQMWKECVSTHTEDYCVNSPQFEAVAVHSKIIGLVRSMYVFHLYKWLKEFPKDQILILHFEERIADGHRVISEVVEFLGLEPLEPELLEHIVNYSFNEPEDDTKEKRLKHQSGRRPGPMMNETRKLLQDFYRPYNQKLAQLLQDEKYLWYDSTKQFTVPEHGKKDVVYESLK